MNNNPAENAIRPNVIGRKNYVGKPHKRHSAKYCRTNCFNGIAIWVQFKRILNNCSETINAFSHIRLATNDIDVLHTRKIMLHRLLSSLMIVWTMRSSTPLKKGISTPTVLMIQLGSEETCVELIKEYLSVMVSSVTGTIVSLVVDIKKHPL